MDASEGDVPILHVDDDDSKKEAGGLMRENIHDKKSHQALYGETNHMPNHQGIHEEQQAQLKKDVYGEDLYFEYLDKPAFCKPLRNLTVK